MVREGGIYINSATSPALYGSSGSTMTGQWIEVLGGSNQPKSVSYYCDKYPVNKYPDGSNLCVEPPSTTRKPPDLDLSNTACTTSNSRCCVYAKELKCDCTACDGKSCKTGKLTLEAARYCGLKIVDSGTALDPLILKRSSTTNVFDLRGTSASDPWRGLEILSSVVIVQKDANDKGVSLFADNGTLTVGKDNKTTSSLTGTARIYFSSISMDGASLIDVTSFEEEGCGKEPDIRTVTVQ